MPRTSLRLLGPPHIELDGEPIHIPRRKATALLAYLTLTRRAHSRDSLATVLWPENDQRSARAELRRTLSLLNRTLGEGYLVAYAQEHCVLRELTAEERVQFGLPAR